jgi:AraC family transcriptional regulator
MDLGIETRASRTLADGLRLVQKTYPSGLRMGRHDHDVWRFCLPIAGSYTDSWRRGFRTRAPWQLSLHPPGEIHTSRFHSDSACFHIEFTGPWADRLLSEAGIAAEPQEYLDGHVPLVAARLYRESRDTDPCSALVLEGLACELIGWAGREQLATGHPEWLGRARELVQDCFNQPLRLDAIARAIGVHPVHLAREFKRHFGQTIGEYVRDLRVAFVSERLGSETPLSLLAAQAGFSDQSHLNRVFKRATGHTPGALRRSR